MDEPKTSAAPEARQERDLVHIFGHRESLSLDARFRFRLPDALAGRLQTEMGRIAGRSDLPPSALQRMAFYFVPGTRGRIFLYPAPNVEVAIERFESPPPGIDPEELRAARDYFYNMMTFVEADRQNRLQIPEHLRDHAGLDGEEGSIVLVSHNLWLSLSKASAAAEMERAGREALEKIGPNVLDPVNTMQQRHERGGDGEN